MVNMKTFRDRPVSLLPDNAVRTQRETSSATRDHRITLRIDTQAKNAVVHASPALERCPEPGRMMEPLACPGS